MDRKTGMFSYHLLAAAVLSLGLTACGGGSSESGNSAGGGDVGGGDGGSGGGGEELAPLLRSASAPSLPCSDACAPGSARCPPASAKTGKR